MNGTYIFEIVNRTIVPSATEELAVVNDNDSRYITFKIPSVIDGIDITDKILTIRYVNSLNRYDQFFCNTREVIMEGNEQFVLFDWVLDSNVTSAKGIVTYDVSIYDTNDMTNVSQYILHTKPATFQVDEGLLNIGAPIEDENALQAAIDSFNAIAAKYYNDTLAASKAAQAAADAAAKSAASLKVDTTLTISGYAADAKTVGDKLAGKAESSNLQNEINRATNIENQLKEDLTEKIPLGINIKNYLDSGNMTTGGYINTDTGNIVEYESWCYSDYIATKSGATLCTIGWDRAQNLWKIKNTTYVAFYNANKTFISGYIAEAGKTYNVPENCSYMRVSFSVDELNYSSLIVEKDAYDKMASVEDRIPYGNFIPTIYDKMGGEYVLIRNPYCVKSYDKLFFKFDSIVFYKNGVQVQLDYNFSAWKEMFPNNWQGYSTSKMSDCVFLKNNEIFTLEVETKKPKIITRPYFFDNPEKYVLILGYDSTNQSYGPFDAQYRLLNDDSYERQRFESLSNETLTKLYDQANPVYKILSDEHFCFAWLSDNHLYGTAGEDETDMTDLAIGEIDKTLNFNAIFNTGDSIQEREGVSGINSLRKIANRFDPDKLVFCEGNHDRNVVSPRLTKTEFYNVVYRQTKNKNIVWGSKENAYYYRDFPTYKIRVIVLNVYEHMYDNDKYDEGKCGYSNTQLEWLANEALQMSEGWSVIVLTHDSPVEMDYNGASNQNNAMQLIQILEAFKDGNNITVQYTDERNSGLFSVNVTTAFSTPGTLIAVLSGHAHCDDAKKVNGINYVQIVCAYIDVVNDYSGYKNRPAFSSKAYAFDIGIVDTENRTLKFKRIGYGADRAINY